MSLLDPGLVLVDLEHVDRLLFGVRCQREDPIHSCRSRNVGRVSGHMQSRLLLDEAAEDGVWRRFAAGDGFEMLDRVPLDVYRDPLLGTVPSDDLIDSAANCRVGCVPQSIPKLVNPVGFASFAGCVSTSAG